MSVTALIRVQRASVMRRPMTWILAAILLAYLLLVTASFLVLLLAPATQGFDADLVLAPMRVGGLPYVAQLGAGIGAILIVVFGASLMGAEFSKGTLRTLLLTGAKRSHVVWAMLAVLVSVCVALAVFGVMVTLLSAWAFSAASGEDLLRLHGPGHAAVTVLSLFLRLLLQFTVWGVLAFAVTLLTRSLLAGIGGVLALQIVGSVAGGILGALGTVGRWAGRLVVNTAVDRATLPVVLEMDAIDWAWVGLNLAAYLVLPMWWAMRRFEKMDVLAATRNA